jgi:hypothetical protein
MSDARFSSSQLRGERRSPPKASNSTRKQSGFSHESKPTPDKPSRATNTKPSSVKAKHSPLNKPPNSPSPTAKRTQPRQRHSRSPARPEPLPAGGRSPSTHQGDDNARERAPNGRSCAAARRPRERHCPVETATNTRPEGSNARLGQCSGITPEGLVLSLLWSEYARSRPLERMRGWIPLGL